MTYKPGLHILSEIKTSELNLLSDFNDVKSFLNFMVEKYNLNKVGEVYHNFHMGGFTGVVCLTESHIAIHTWPEYGLLTLDIYLSNCKKTNDQKSIDMFDDITRFFNSTEYKKQEVYR